MSGSIARLFSRLRAFFRNPWNQYGCIYVGRYSPGREKIDGYVEPDGKPIGSVPPKVVVVFRDAQPIGTTEEFEPHSKGWWYRVILASPLDPRDVLQDRIKVFALDNLGSRSALRAEGGPQLAFIKDSDAAAAGSGDRVT